MVVDGESLMGGPEFGINHNNEGKMSKYTVTAWPTTWIQQHGFPEQTNSFSPKYSLD